MNLWDTMKRINRTCPDDFAPVLGICTKEGDFLRYIDEEERRERREVRERNKKIKRVLAKEFGAKNVVVRPHRGKHYKLVDVEILVPDPCGGKSYYDMTPEERRICFKMEDEVEAEIMRRAKEALKREGLDHLLRPPPDDWTQSYPFVFLGVKFVRDSNVRH